MNWLEKSIVDMTSTKPVDYHNRVKYICTTGDISIILVGDLDLLCGTFGKYIGHFYADDGFGNAVKVGK